MEAGYNSYSPASSMQDKKLALALKRQSEAWRSLAGNRDTLVTPASGVYPGSVQVNYGGILGNALGTYQGLTKQQEAEDKITEEQKRAYNALMSIVREKDLPQEVAVEGAAAIHPALGKMTVEAAGTPKSMISKLDAMTSLGLDIAKEKDPTFNEKQGLATIANEAVVKPDGTYAASPKGAVGPAQIMPDTAASLNKKYGTTLDINNPMDNVQLMAMLQKENRQMYPGDVARQVSAYNAGPAATNASPTGVAQNNETQDYTQKVLRDMGLVVPTNSASQRNTNTGEVSNTTYKNRAAKYSDEQAINLAYWAKDLGLDIGPLITPKEETIDNMLARAVSENDTATIEKLMTLKERVAAASQTPNHPTQTDLDKTTALQVSAFTEQNGRPPTAVETAKIRDTAVQTNKNQLDPIANYEAQRATKRIKDIDKILGTTTQALPSLKTGTTSALTQLDQLATHPGKSWALGRVTGLMPEASVFKGDTNNFRAKLKSVEFKAMEQGLTEMRKSGSPGTITEKEWPIMQGLITEMKTAQTEEAFDKSLTELKARVQSIQENAEISVAQLAAERKELQSQLGPQEAPAEGSNWYMENGKKVYY